jgi:hypothetical protein
MNWELLIAVFIGLGLAASCGFRVFVPPLIMSAAGMAGYLNLSPEMGWMASLPALIAFATATLIEIAAYYIPIVDHALDTVAAPLAVVAGTVVAASTMTDFSPIQKWSIALIAGGGVSGVIQLATTASRGLSMLNTAGFANPIVSTIETVLSFMLSLVALVLPVLAIILVGVILTVVILVWRKFASSRTKSVQSASSEKR